MKVTYIQHSGFMVELEECVLVFDYYKGLLPSVSKDKKLYVFSSHHHHDHFEQSTSVIFCRTIYRRKQPGTESLWDRMQNWSLNKSK